MNDRLRLPVLLLIAVLTLTFFSVAVVSANGTPNTAGIRDTASRPDLDNTEKDEDPSLVPFLVGGGLAIILVAALISTAVARRKRMKQNLPLEYERTVSHPPMTGAQTPPPPVDSGRFCSKCGAKLASGSVICNHCGHNNGGVES